MHMVRVLSLSLSICPSVSLSLFLRACSELRYFRFVFRDVYFISAHSSARQRQWEIGNFVRGFREERGGGTRFSIILQ